MASVLTHNPLQIFQVTFPQGPKVAWPQRRTLRTGQCVSSIRSQLGLRSLRGNPLSGSHFGSQSAKTSSANGQSAGMSQFTKKLF